MSRRKNVDVISKNNDVENEENQPTNAFTSVTGEVIRCVKLNIRETPDPNAKIIGTLDAGEKVVINLTANYHNYYEILSKSGKKGYAMKTYLSIIEN